MAEGVMVHPATLLRPLVPWLSSPSPRAPELRAFLERWEVEAKFMQTKVASGDELAAFVALGARYTHLLGEHSSADGINIFTNSF
jgi:hypothetical protein